MELIVAMNLDGVIGISDASGEHCIPWHLPEDLRRFREKTMGNILVMGRKTLESLPGGRPLAGRIHIVLSKTHRVSPDGNVVYTTYENFNTTLSGFQRDNPSRRVFICGGAEIYNLFRDRCDTIHLTMVYKPIAPSPEYALVRLGYSLESIVEKYELMNSTPILYSSSGEKLRYEFWEFARIGTE
jgi:dihydrofolate reductase